MMIEYFPMQPHTGVITCEDFRHHTRAVLTEGLTFAQRSSVHYTALLRSPSLKRNNSRNGYCFSICIYDALVAVGVDPQRITLHTRASKEHHDDIDLRVAPCVSTKAPMCFYLKASMRERWKQVDRDARIAKDRLGNSIKTVCLSYAEDGVQGFFNDCTHKAQALEKKFTRMEEWACGVDHYAALSQTTKVNAIIAYLLETPAHVNGIARHEC